MPCLIDFSSKECAPASETLHDLHAIHTEWMAAVRQHLEELKDITDSTQLKRKRVALEKSVMTRHVSPTPLRHERLGELLNILPTVHRTCDALQWVASQTGLEVHRCNPSTSNFGHDIEAKSSRRHVLTGVSDVAGKGNANNTLRKDLVTLLHAYWTAPDAGVSAMGPELMLAVSPSSAEWLTGKTGVPKDLGAQVVSEARVSYAEGQSPTSLFYVLPIEITAALEKACDTRKIVPRCIAPAAGPTVEASSDGSGRAC